MVDFILINIRNAAKILLVAALLSSCSSTDSVDRKATPESNPCATQILKGHKVYKWTDTDGNVHYGDSLPPELGKQDYEVLKDQDVAVENRLLQESRCTKQKIEERQKKIRHNNESIKDGPEQYRSKEEVNPVVRSE